MNRISILALATLAATLTACSSGGGGSGIDMSDKTAIHKDDQCPRVKGEYCSTQTQDGSKICEKYTVSESSDGLTLSTNDGLPDVKVDGKIYDGPAPFKIQAYCANGKLTRTATAGSHGALRFTLSLSPDGNELVVDQKGTGGASKMTGTVHLNKN